jgi:hypothetical protein
MNFLPECKFTFYLKFKAKAKIRCKNVFYANNRKQFPRTNSFISQSSENNAILQIYCLSYIYKHGIIISLELGHCQIIIKACVL